MKMFRNKDFRILTLAFLSLSLLLTIAGFMIGMETGLLILVTVVLFYMMIFGYVALRNRAIEKLSDYLRRIAAGHITMDIRDNREGELSILKNEIYKVTLMLTEYNDLLKREKLLLTDQMADISHQLKTPLTSMMVMVDLLRDENLSMEKRNEFITMMSNQLNRIHWLISSLLKISKLDAGVVTMKAEKIPSDNLIKKSLDPLLISMEIKEISYSLVSDHHPIICDIEWTSEAILNIIKNCIEHTSPGGTITIQVRENPLYSEILIMDNGSGIVKEDLAYIFTLFYRGKNASPDSVGIGLAMAYRIITSQNGDILVHSEIGKGTTFAVRLYKK